MDAPEYSGSRSREDDAPIVLGPPQKSFPSSQRSHSQPVATPTQATSNGYSSNNNATQSNSYRRGNGQSRQISPTSPTRATNQRRNDNSYSRGGSRPYVARDRDLWDMPTNGPTSSKYTSSNNRYPQPRGNNRSSGGATIHYSPVPANAKNSIEATSPPGFEFTTSPPFGSSPDADELPAMTSSLFSFSGAANGNRPESNFIDSLFAGAESPRASSHSATNNQRAASPPSSPARYSRSNNNDSWDSSRNSSSRALGGWFTAIDSALNDDDPFEALEPPSPSRGYNSPSKRDNNHSRRAPTQQMYHKSPVKGSAHTPAPPPGFGGTSASRALFASDEDEHHVPFSKNRSRDSPNARPSPPPGFSAPLTADDDQKDQRPSKTLPPPPGLAPVGPPPGLSITPPASAEPNSSSSEKELPGTPLRSSTPPISTSSHFGATTTTKDDSDTDAQPILLFDGVHRPEPAFSPSEAETDSALFSSIVDSIVNDDDHFTSFQQGDGLSDSGDGLPPVRPSPSGLDHKQAEKSSSATTDLMAPSQSEQDAQPETTEPPSTPIKLAENESASNPTTPHSLDSSPSTDGGSRSGSAKKPKKSESQASLRSKRRTLKSYLPTKATPPASPLATPVHDVDSPLPISHLPKNDAFTHLEANEPGSTYSSAPPAQFPVQHQPQPLQQILRQQLQHQLHAPHRESVAETFDEVDSGSGAITPPTSATTPPPNGSTQSNRNRDSNEENRGNRHQQQPRVPSPTSGNAGFMFMGGARPVGQPMPHHPHHPGHVVPHMHSQHPAFHMQHPGMSPHPHHPAMPYLLPTQNMLQAQLQLQQFQQMYHQNMMAQQQQQQHQQMHHQQQHPQHPAVNTSSTFPRGKT